LQAARRSGISGGADRRAGNPQGAARAILAAVTSDGDSLRRRWQAGQPAFGGWCTIPSALSAEIVGQLGFDWVCVDLQHGLAGLESAAPMLQAISVTGAVPLARVPANEPWLVMRVLDLGASGVVVPLVSSPAEAERAAAACRYPPEGVRSWGPVRTAPALGADAAERNRRVLCLVMVETREGVESLDAICAVPGVDGVYIGPRDLGLSYGLEPGEELDAVVERILTTCRAHGVPAGIHTRSGEAARRYAEAGFLFASVATDRELLAGAARRELAAALGAEPRPAQAAADGLLRAAVSYVVR
jgi:4-hydroxy-2-oxoheptanedioate aldolase